eukprot:SAG22_NODE_15892_length_337_cov_1.689076_1_plen_75_part_01
MMPAAWPAAGGHGQLLQLAPLVLAAVAAVAPGPASGIQNGVGLTPPMGWRSWNQYGANVTQADITAQIGALARKY